MKRFFAFILTLSILLCCTAPSVGAIYEEDSGLKLSDWAIDSYHMANEYGILNWFNRNEDFTVPITRAEFCDMVFNVVRDMNNGIAAEIDVLAPAPFTDTDRYSVYCLSQLGIAEGIGGGLFNPNATLTREQAATFMYRAGEILDFSYLSEKRAAFTDVSAIASWATSAADAMQSSGLMIGTDTGAFLPQSLLTREQAATMLVRFLEKNGYNSGIYIKDEDNTLTLSDFDGLNGKYRTTGENSYKVTYYQGNFANVVVNVSAGNIESAILTYMGSGATVDLKKQKQDDILSPINGRYYLGNNAYQIEADGKQSLELNGKVVLTLPASEYGSVGYQKMNGSYAAYAIKDGNTVFFALPDGNAKFTVDGFVHCITNRYIITETTRYSGSTVDAAYSVYGVYSLDGKQIESMGLQHDELYQKGYITDY